MNRYAEALQKAGMSAPEAEAKSRLFDQLQRTATELGIGAVKHAFFIPGRIEVLGKHTDYAGGRSLLCAIERGFTITVTPRHDTIIDVRDTRRSESFRTSLDATANAPRGSWGSYVAAVARRIGRDFPHARTGADIALSSTLPADAGLSSSSALVVSIALALIAAN